MSTKPIAVITTVGNVDEARRLARQLVEERLAACAQLSAIESFYSWKGVLENDQEYRILFKTTADRYPDVERRLKELHSYELPAIYAVSIDQAFAPYAEWVEANSRGLSG